MEWQEIFQVLKSKGLKPILLYPARLSIKMEGKIEVSQTKKTERILLHQTSTIRYTKVTALRKGRKTVRGRNRGMKEIKWQ